MGRRGRGEEEGRGRRGMGWKGKDVWGRRDGRREERRDRRKEERRGGEEKGGMGEGEEKGDWGSGEIGEREKRERGGEIEERERQRDGGVGCFEGEERGLGRKNRAREQKQRRDTWG